MKIRLFSLVLTAMMLVSCGRTVDWAPVNLYVRVCDSEGNDLLDSARDNSWLEGTVMVWSGGEELLQLTPPTRTYMPDFTGFRLEGGYSDGYRLVFGELNGEKQYRNEQFIIRWPDSTEDVITLTRRLNYITIDAKTVWRLNGEKTDSPIVIVK